jgi:hypothetical protein
MVHLRTVEPAIGKPETVAAGSLIFEKVTPVHPEIHDQVPVPKVAAFAASVALLKPSESV